MSSRNRFVHLTMERRTAPQLLEDTQMPVLVATGATMPLEKFRTFGEAKEFLTELEGEGSNVTEALMGLDLMFKQKKHHKEIGLIMVEEAQAILPALNSGDALGDGYYLTTTVQDVDVIQSIMEWVADKNVLFFPTVKTTDELQQLKDFVAEKDATKIGDRTWPSVHETDHMGIAAASLSSGHFFGKFWLKFKGLVGISVTKFSDEQVDLIDSLNGNTYIRVNGKSMISNSFVIGGEFMDIIQTEDYLVSKVTDAIFSTLTTVNKINYDQKGIDQIHGALIGVLQEASQPDRSVLLLDENGNTTFTTKAPLRSEIDTKYISNRILPDLEFTAIPTGAIGEVMIHGILTFGGEQ